jgi:phosphoribosyl 1,2-cyclic phosphodiesterase
VRISFCGVRGSTPAPGAAFTIYGGHTSCVALAHDDEQPTLVLDAGTGLRRLGEDLGDSVFQGSILLGHLHWDHVHGLPFFGAGTRPGHRVDVLLPAPDDDPVATLARGLSPPHFPIGPHELGAGWTFSRLSEGKVEREGFTILAREIPHKGGQTFGFRVTDSTGAVAYLSDHWPLSRGPGADGQGELHPAALELAAGVDVLIHDAQFLAREFPGVAHLGHASVEYARVLATAAGARNLVLYHHAPTRTDQEISEIMRALSPDGVRICAAREGMVIDL